MEEVTEFDPERPETALSLSDAALVAAARRRPWWRWMEGMRRADAENMGAEMVPLRVCGSGEAPVFLNDRAPWMDEPRLLAEGGLPDIDDAATAGCIEEMLRPVWSAIGVGDRLAVVMDHRIPDGPTPFSTPRYRSLWALRVMLYLDRAMLELGPGGSAEKNDAEDR